MERTDSFFIRASVLTDSTNFNQSAIDLGASQDDDLILINDQLDVGPQDFTDGYLIAVEQMYLGVDERSTVTAQVSVVLECTVYGRYVSFIETAADDRKSIQQQRGV